MKNDSNVIVKPLYIFNIQKRYEKTKPGVKSGFLVKIQKDRLVLAVSRSAPGFPLTNTTS